MAEQKGHIRQKLSHYRTLLAILLVTTFVWCVWVMSEDRTYSLDVRVSIEGVDTVQYVVTEYDTIVTLDAESDGFAAVKAYFKSQKIRVPMDFQNSKRGRSDMAIAMSDWLPVVKGTLDLPPALRLASRMDSVRLSYAAREKKGFVPKVKDVQFNFSAHYGLNGVPKILPDTVWLYGSQASLDQIKELCTSPTVVADMDQTGNYTLPLEPVWEQFGDVRTSVSEITMYIPVGEFVEKTFTVPIQMPQTDSSMNVRLYPDQVNVKIMVEKQDYARLEASAIKAGISNDALVGDSLKVIITRFPPYARIKHIEPQYVQYVVIR